MGGKIYCFANFYCYSIVFGPKFREGQKFSGGGGGGAPLWKKASFLFILKLSFLEPFHNTWSCASTAKIEEVVKFYNLGNRLQKHLLKNKKSNNKSITKI